MNIPSDCLIVKPKEGVAPFTHLTWNANGCPKTIPLDIYKLNEYRLVIVEDPNNLIPNEAPETINKPESKTDFVKEAKDVTDALIKGDVTKANEEAKDLLEKVKKVGKGKNKKR